ncbi:dicarboxylate/amino acid:cation symporter [Halegenticoccus soli]|uniref:dicarboxylate/amino acid:cation symporter n=1 Tax=Halegenticoccus soli TaxID=1985678 RepID=UPI000C6D9163|nr:dicarboxylate/amino acid:cation symporter [Halegenticoccus soli]
MTTAVTSAWRTYRSVPIIYRIAAAFVLGSALGLVVGRPATALQPLGDLFVRLLGMIIVPIVVFTLLLGARKLTPSTLGRIGGQVVALYLITTAVAIVIGLGVANLVDPGIGLEIADAEAQSAEAPSLVEVVLGIVPENPIGAMAAGDVLPTIFFTVVFGIALATLVEESEAGTAVHDGAEAIFDVAEAGAEAMFKVVWGVMEYGVVGVFALMAATFGEAGAEAILPFAKLVAALALAVGVHIGLTYLLVMQRGLMGESPTAFLAGAKDAMITALSIRSSSGTLPVTMSDAEGNFGVDEEVYGFSLPLGATINMDGTAMYQGVAAVFAANLVGETLTLGQQFTVVLTALLASVGTAGVPGSGLIMLTLVLTQLGLPLEVVGMVAGVDPILDRLRTMNNVAGDLAVTTLVAKWNGAIDYAGTVWSESADVSTVGTVDD